jgi:5-hydroxyisourate hydrolase
MSRITTHVLDTVLGKPAAGVALRLDCKTGCGWAEVAASATDGDGRCRDLAPEAAAGTYRITFETGAYFARAGRRSIYPEVSIVFECGGDEHYHLPLLVSDNSYTTYRGS